MKNTTVDFEKYLNFHKEYGGTGKIFKFKFLEYKKGVLKLEGEFTSMALNPNQSVQGGQMNSMLDDVTSLLVIYESKGEYYPSSTNLHSIHHRPLFAGKATASAEIIKIGKKIASIKGELHNKEGKLATTLIHTAVLVKALPDE